GHEQPLANCQILIEQRGGERLIFYADCLVCLIQDSKIKDEAMLPCSFCQPLAALVSHEDYAATKRFALEKFTDFLRVGGCRNAEVVDLPHEFVPVERRSTFIAAHAQPFG